MNPERRVFDGAVHKHDRRLRRFLFDLFLSFHDELLSFVLIRCGLTAVRQR